MKRRDFIRNTGLASASLLVPKFLYPFTSSAASFAGRRLIVIQLSGGNDGLNCVVPFRNDLYYQYRPDISVYGKSLINITGEAALNIQLRSFYDLLDKGNAAVLNNVGYPNPSRSHFRSLDIWQSASDHDQYIQSGWLGRALDNTCDDGCAPPHMAVETEDSLSLALKGENFKGIALRDLKKIRTSIPDDLHSHDEHSGQQATFLRKTLTDAVNSVSYLHEKTGKTLLKTKYPDHQFAERLKMIAGLILSGSETMVYYISLPGFDTHAFQKNIQNRLLKVYADSLKVFCGDLQAGGELNNTLILTFSEFGRRVEQNASKGTDHGGANVIFLAGGGLKQKGMINQLPDLSNLSDGDLMFDTDFRSVYATVLKKWLNLNPVTTLGREFPLLNFV